MKNRKTALFYSVGASAFAVDQLSKLLVLDFFSKTVPASTPLFRYLSLTLVKNPGICFGMFQQQNLRIPIIIFSFAVLILIAVYVHRLCGSVFMCFSLGLIQGGISGNLLDRIIHGAVIDFIDLHFWPVFNFADAFIVSGVILAGFMHIRGGNASNVSEAG